MRSTQPSNLAHVPEITVTVDGSSVVAESGTTAGALFRSAELDAVVARDGSGELRDLSWKPADGDVLDPVPMDSPDGLAVLRHSSAHVLAQAVQELFPSAKLGIGPPITNGFYYDFDVDTPFTPEDLEQIEARMRKIVKEGQTFTRRVVTDDEARSELAAEPYKLELIGLKGAAAEAAEGASMSRSAPAS